MEDCVFCRIIAGEAPASFVYQDDQVVAFMDIRPVNRGHTLVIPRVHAERIADLDGSVGGRLFAIAMTLSQGVQRSVSSDGINLHAADGEAAGQEVAHFHLHIIPRFKDDGFGGLLRFRRHFFSWPNRETLDQAAESISKALAAN